VRPEPGDPNQYIPYGPFIAIGAIISLFWGDAIIDWYTD
jgi:prepilin signal peptidase PulO-like enzyme (type II secretory pathway)